MFFSSPACLQIQRWWASPCTTLLMTPGSASSCTWRSSTWWTSTEVRTTPDQIQFTGSVFGLRHQRVTGWMRGQLVYINASCSFYFCLCDICRAGHRVGHPAAAQWCEYFCCLSAGLDNNTILQHITHNPCLWAGPCWRYCVWVSVHPAVPGLDPPAGLRESLILGVIDPTSCCKPSSCWPVELRWGIIAPLSFCRCFSNFS